MGLRKTTEQFIKEVKEKNKHSELDLSLVEYKGCDKDVTVICPIHGKFDIQASYLLQGSGCRKCADEHRNDDRRTSMEEFQNIVFQKYGNKLDPSLAKFRTVRDKIIMKCVYHDKFETTAERIMRGDGCSKCNLEEIKRKDNEKKEGFYSEKKLKKLWHTNNPKVIAEEFKIESTTIDVIGGKGTFYPKDECDKVIEYLNNYVKNFDGNEESARKQFMVDIRRKKMSFESRGLISVVQLAKEMNVSRHGLYRTIDYLNIPYHKEIDPIGHVEVRVISLNDVDKIKEFYQVENKSKILTKDTILNDYGSVENFTKLRTQKILNIKNNWTEEQKNQVIQNMRTAQRELANDPIRAKQKLDRTNKTHIENYGSLENYGKHLGEEIKKYISENKDEWLAKIRKSFEEYLKIRGITEEEFHKERYECILKSLSEKYGKEITNINQIPNWKEKVQECWKNKTVEELNEIVDKARKTLFENYGVYNAGDLVRYQKLHYNGVIFDSSWELMVYLYLQDNNIPFEFHKKGFYFNYDCEGKKCRYYPDFIINNKIYEVKGGQYYDKNGIMINPYDSTDKRPQYKQKLMEKLGVIVIKEKDMDKYIKNFKKNHSDIILTDLYKKKE